MEKLVRFFKQNKKWYADVPNHTLEENEMVCGADELLDFITFGGTLKELTLKINTEEFDKYLIHLIKQEQDDVGCTYKVDGNPFAQVFSEIWLCNVTLDVLGEFPKNLFIDIYTNK